MEQFLAQNFSFTWHSDLEKTHIIYTNCNFSHSTAEDFHFDQCFFDNCDFTLLRGIDGIFERCVFKNCNLTSATFSDVSFLNCHAIMSNFEHVEFVRSIVDFEGTDKCDFTYSRFIDCERISSSSREIVSEIVRQAGDNYQIQAFAAFIRFNKLFCWESLIENGLKLLVEPVNLEKVRKKLSQYPNYSRLIDKFMGKEVQNGKSSNDLERVDQRRPRRKQYKANFRESKGPKPSRSDA